MGPFISGQDAVASQLSVDVDAAPLPPKDVLLSVRTGKIRPLGGVKIRSAINKLARPGRVRVTEVGIPGDESEFIMAGGPERALHQYCSAHYTVWNTEVPDRQHLFKIGGFGENLSAALLHEGNVCIGDKFRIGSEVIIQVTQPRSPCYKLNHRFQYNKASIMAQNTGRTGWHNRVLKTGHIQEGDPFELVERINPHWPIARVLHYLYQETDNVDAMTELTRLPAFGEETADVFRQRLSRGTADFSGRLNGDRLPITWQVYRLTEKSDLTSRIKRFVLQRDGPDDAVVSPLLERFPYVRLQFGLERSFTRAYSVVSGDMRQFELGVARDDRSRGGSSYLHDQLNVGDVVRVAKGHGNQQTSGADRDCGRSRSIYIVGGIGITAFIRELRTFRPEQQDWELHYAVRSRRDAAYLDTLPRDKTTVYARDEGQRLQLQDVIPDLGLGDTGGTRVYCCGPATLLGACRDLTAKLNYPPSHVHLEEFGGAATGTGDPFEAQIKSTGQVMEVPPDKSLLQVLTAAGLDIEGSCLVGNCGTCMVGYCSGEVVHRGLALNDEQKKESMLGCVSRGQGRIVLDC